MFKKKDILLIAVVLLFALGMALAMGIGQGKSGGQIRIMVDGKEYGTYSLFENRIIEVENEYGYNKLVLKNGEVSMEKADCPDQYCVEHVPVSKANETIVCLPHKLVVEVHTLEENGIDSVSQ